MTASYPEYVLNLPNPALAEPTDSFDELYAPIRAVFVQRFSRQERKLLLENVYGPQWASVEAYPKHDALPHIQRMLADFALPASSDGLLREEYRRLFHGAGEKYKLFCLDMDGLILEKGLPVPGIRDAIADVKQRHRVAVTTAVPTHEARFMLAQSKLSALLPNVYGDLAHRKGKKYEPVADDIGLPFPHRHLVAVSHGLEDIPADIDIPFMHLNAPLEQRARAFLEGVRVIETNTFEGAIQKTPLSNQSYLLTVHH